MTSPPPHQVHNKLKSAEEFRLAAQHEAARLANLGHTSRAAAGGVGGGARVDVQRSVLIKRRFAAAAASLDLYERAVAANTALPRAAGWEVDGGHSPHHTTGTTTHPTPPHR